MKILAILESPAGGEEKAARSLLEEAQKQGLEVETYCLSPLKKTNIFHYCFWIIFSCSKSAFFLLQKRNVKILYTTTYTAALACVFISWFTKQKVLFHYHGSRIPALPHSTLPKNKQFTQLLKRVIVTLFHREAWRRVTVFCTPSEEVVNELTESFPKLGLTQKVLPNGVKLDEFFPVTKKQKENIRRKYKIKSDYVVSIVGRIDPLKNQIESISFIKKQIKHTKKQYTLVIAAPQHGNDEYYINKVLNELKKASFAHLLVFENNPICEIYQLSDYVISHSKVEVFPLTLLEAASCGVPYFAKKNGMIEHLLNRIDTRYVLTDTSIISHEFLHQISRKGLKSFSGERSIERVAKEFLFIIEEMSHKSNYFNLDQEGELLK